MGNNIYRNVFGVFALLAAGFVLFGCTGAPAANTQGPAVCSTDLYQCQGGATVARDPANGCQFATCPAVNVCAQDATLCPDGSYVSRNSSKSCAFDACPAPAACMQGAKLCYGGSYVFRNSSKNCAFDACPIVAIPTPVPVQNNTTQTPINSSLANVGEACAGSEGIRCQYWLQCITSGLGDYGTCTEPAPPSQDMQQCPTDRYATCTTDFTPVCGKGTDSKSTFRDYVNSCEACSIRSNAIGYYFGTCENQ